MKVLLQKLNVIPVRPSGYVASTFEPKEESNPQQANIQKTVTPDGIDFNQWYNGGWNEYLN